MKPSVNKKRLTVALLTILFVWNPKCFADQYDKLPRFDDLSSEQKRLLQTVPPRRTQYDGERHWEELTEDQQATFFQITYVLERTAIKRGQLIDYVVGIEETTGIIEGDENHHEHYDGKHGKIDGWRIHVSVNGKITAVELESEGFDKESDAHDTHKVFGFVHSFRDYRESVAPFLQIVLDEDDKGADIDVDKGKFFGEFPSDYLLFGVHASSPRKIYRRLSRKYPDIERVYVVGK
jgi:hypothetical protein